MQGLVVVRSAERGKRGWMSWEMGFFKELLRHEVHATSESFDSRGFSGLKRLI
jgi:hypothetical protein